MRRLALLSAAAAAAIAGLWVAHALAQSPFHLRVTTGAAGATDVVDFKGQTYASAKAAIAARETAGSATVPVTFTGLTDLVSNNALLSTDDASFGIALQGSTTFLGQPGTLLVTATWPDATATTPDVAVLVRFDSVTLHDLNPAWNAVPVTFGPAIVGVTDTDHTIAPNAALNTDAFLADGLADTDDSFALSHTGVNMQAAVLSGPLTDAAGDLGTTANGIRLRGTLAASLGVLNSPSPGAGLKLAVDIPITTPASFPSWVSLASPWTLSLEADTSGTFAASFAGGLTVKPDGKTPVSATGTATVTTSTAGDTSLALTMNIGALDNLFGQSWLDLHQTTLNATIAKTGFTASFTAGLTLGPLSSDVTLAVEASTTDFRASLDLKAAGPVSTADLLNALGAPTAGVDAGLVNISINTVALHVAVDAPTGGQQVVTAAAFGDASLSINAGTFNGQMLFRVVYDGGAPDLLVGARLKSPTLKQLDPNIAFDWQLPDFAIEVSTADRATPYAELDAPTQLYFAPVLCDAQGTCADLDVKQGLKIQALVSLPQDLIDQLGNLGITVGGPLDISGTLPIFGGSQVSLKVALPTISGGANSLVKQGTVSFDIVFDKVTKDVKTSIDGNIVFRITRSGACDGTEAGTWPGTSNCYDELNLTVSATLSLSPTNGVEISLAAQIDEWNHAFGVDWLKINTFRLQLGLKAGGSSPVSLDIGILGRLTIGTGTQTKDLTLAIKVAITPTPPWINLTGFTLASGDGIGLREIAQLFDPQFDTSTLPDLSLKNIWLAYGTETDEALCIRQGLFLSAELHLGAPTSANSTPGCIPSTTLPADPAQLPTGSCEQANTCLASILIDVQTGSDPSFTAAGFIRKFDAGPIHIDSTKVVLQLSASKQRFYFSGGASITDITGVTTDVWASGALTIDLRNDAGNASLFIDGNVNIGGADGLTARLTGTVAADFSKLGSGQLSAFLASLNFDLSYELTFPALDKFGNQVNQAFTPVKDWVDTTGNQVTAAFDPSSNQDLKNFLDTFAPVSNAPQYTALQGYSGAAGTAAASIQSQADAYYNYISGYWQLRFYDVTLSDGTTQNAREYFLGEVSKRTQGAVVVNGGLGNITLNGIDRILIQGQDVGLEHIKDYRLTITGVCGAGGSLVGNPVCTGGPSSLSTNTVAPLAGALFTKQTSYTLPTGPVAPAALAVARQAAFAQAALAATPPTNEIDAINRLQTSFTTPGLAVQCATVKVHYSPNGNVQDPAVVTLDAYGAQTSIRATVDPRNIQQPISPTATVQDSINTILSAETAPAPCQQPAAPVGPGGTSISIAQGTINEGGSASVSGIAATAFFGKVITVTWGDGSTTDVIASAADGTWSSRHTYPDDTGPGSSSRFLISATAAGVADANFTRVTVNNVAPTLTLSPVATAVTEGSSLTLTGRFTDPGTLDAHTVVVSWGDGSANTTVAFPAGQIPSFNLTHVYEDDDPSLTPSDKVTVVVKLTDSDGGQASANAPVAVNNVAPTNLKLDAVTAGGAPVNRDAAGHALVAEGSVVIYTGSFRDAGVKDTERVAIDWGDTTRGDTATVVRDTADPSLLHFSASHAYVDDNPTGSPSDLFTITLLAADDDTGTATVTDQVRVDDVAPVVTVAAVPATTENVGITLSASFTDVGLADTHTAVVDWGDGTTPQTVTVAQARGSGTLVSSHVYGDNGTFTVTVKVTDDDTVAGVGTTTVRVDNVNPAVTIDRGTTMSFGGVATLVGVQNSPVAFKGSVTDPGSDDITVTWAFGDGLTNVTTNLVNPPATDPALSASVQPRSFAVANNHPYTSPCLYRAALSARDDDGGIATPDGIDVVILASAHRWESLGFWKNQYRGKASIGAADLACYLKMVSHMSTVFGVGDPVPLATSAQATAVLSKEPETELSQLDRELLVAWLNIANGALPLTTLVVGEDGRPTQTVAAILVGAEKVRRDPTSTKRQLEAAKDAVKRLHKD